MGRAGYDFQSPDNEKPRLERGTEPCPRKSYSSTRPCSSKLDAMVREKVERIVNAMPDASGGRDRQRRGIRAFRRTEGVPGRPLRAEPDRQGRQARAQGAEIEGRPVRVRGHRTLPQTRGKRRGGADRHVPGRRVHQAGRRHRPVAVGRPHAVPRH